jgi:redox-sensitive bicupin YhaK (pirin superfamily)
MPAQLLEPHRKDLGGFFVSRVLPQAGRRMVGPFVFYDHFGPATFEPNFPRSADVRPHPHIGLSTVTYLFDGAITHRDSTGVTQDIAPGEVNWMVAGRGITHSERFEKLRPTGGVMHGIQAWVALPTEFEEADPSFHHHAAADLPTYEHGGLWARLIAGKAFGAVSPVKTHSPMFYVHWALKAGTEAQLADEYPERAAFVAQGEVTVDGRTTLKTGQMLVLEPGAPARFKAETDSIVMLLGGEPVGPRYVDWNFVASSKERIEQAKADWRAGRMKLPDADNQEFIPLPDPPPAPPPMS